MIELRCIECGGKPQEKTYDKLILQEPECRECGGEVRLVHEDEDNQCPAN